MSHRREFLKRSILGAATSATLSRPWWAVANTSGARPTLPSGSNKPRRVGHRVLERKVISHDPQKYCGWPTVAQRASGELVLVYSGGREGHVCPFGRVEFMRSRDGGKNWTWPQVILDGPIDDRDAGIVETAQGTLLATTFTSLAYVPSLEKAERAGNWDETKLSRWRAAHQRADADGRQQALGVWITRSTDGGITWSERRDSKLNSPHGPIQLSDGRLIYAGKHLWNNDGKIGVAESTDDGVNWEVLAYLPTREGDRHADYHELHIVECNSGKLVAHIRNHNKNNSRETLQSVSTDGGRTWSTPQSIGVWGLPSHLLRLRDGRLLMSYGYRRQPYGNEARVSENEGASWSEPIKISDDAIGGDLGYPSTVQLDDGQLLSIWYELMSGSPRAVLRQSVWELRD